MVSGDIVAHAKVQGSASGAPSEGPGTASAEGGGRIAKRCKAKKFGVHSEGERF